MLSDLISSSAYKVIEHYHLVSNCQETHGVTTANKTKTSNSKQSIKR